MSELKNVKKICFVTSTFNLEKMLPGDSHHYEISKDGNVKTYLTLYKKRRHFDTKSIRVSDERIKTFFHDVSYIVTHSGVPVMIIDDCARRWTITFENEKSIYEGDLITDDGQSLEKRFWEFVSLVGL